MQFAPALATELKAESRAATSSALTPAPATMPSSVQAVPSVETEQNSMLPMNPTSKATTTIKLPDGVQPFVFESSKHRAAAWAKYQRSLDLGKSYRVQRRKREED